MRKILTLLRDPLWQIVSIFIAVIAIFLGYSQSGESEFSIIPSDEFTKFDNYFPSSKIKLIIEGEGSDINNLYFGYFNVMNFSSVPLKAEDFKSNVSVESIRKNIEIVLVSACELEKSPVYLQSSSKPAFDWIVTKQKWQLQPELINPKESGCMILIVRSLSQDNRPVKWTDFSWGGRIAGSTLKFYPTSEAFQKSKTRPIDYLQVQVVFDGKGVIWFLILQYFLMVIPLYISNKSNILNRSTMLETNKFYIFIFLSITTSEILVSKFLYGLEQHPIVYPLILVHFFLVIYIVYKAHKARKLQ